AGVTDFDDVRAATQATAPQLDTLLTVAIKQFQKVYNGPVMTVYHGHDLPRPFIMSGFPPWMFRRAECSALFDFVLRRLWAMPRASTTAAAAGLAHRTPTAPARTASAAPSAPVRSLRGLRSPR